MKKTKLFAAITAAVISMATITSCGTADIEAIPKDGTYRPVKSIGYCFAVPGSGNENCKLVINGRKGRIYSWSLDNITGHWYPEIICELGEWEKFDNDKSDYYWKAVIKTYVEEYDAASNTTVLEPRYPKGLGYNFGCGLSSKNGKKIYFVHTKFEYKNGSTIFEPDNNK